MNDVQLATVLRSIRRSAAPRLSERADAELLHDFTDRNDSSAFDQLVQRYGPVVLGVCRRVLGHAEDAEDAFQATFLVLARKAGSIRRKESLASWLYGVSYRIAMKAKRDAARRRKHESQAKSTSSASTSTDLAWREVQAVLDEEVEKLAPIHRSAFVLCCFQGLSHAEAAQELGVKEGTISSRLTHARRRLRDALARRGITLSAVLSALALSKRARAQVPSTLRESTTQAATQYVVGTVQGLSAKTLSLAEGAIRTMLTTKVKLATLLFLTLSMLGLGAVLLPFREASAGEPREQKSKARHESNNPQSPRSPAFGEDVRLDNPTKLQGKVVGPDSKPVDRATVAVWANRKKVKETTTSKDGRFQLTVSLSKLERPLRLVASAEQLGVDWRALAAVKGDVTLRLPKDDLPIEGRILDLEGRPVLGATVEVYRFGKLPANREVDAWLKKYKSTRRMAGDFRVSGSRMIGRYTKVKVDANGRYRLTGHGRGRLVNLYVRGPGTEHSLIQVLVHPGPSRGWDPGRWGLYPAKHDVVLGPAKPIIGTVRDSKTKKPIAGIRVMAGPSTQKTFKTDKNGQFRIEGVSKSSEYWLSAGGEIGLPYFDRTRHNIADTPGLEPLRVDVELDRGIEITGKVLNRKTGDPVNGRVGWHSTTDNPNLKDYASLGGPRIVVSDFGTIQPDGTFTVLGIPGPGAVSITADDRDAFVQRIPKDVKLGNLIQQAYHAIVPVDPDPKNPSTLRCTVKLEPGVSVTGTLLDPDGKPVPRAYAAGLSPVLIGFGPARALADADFQVGGLDERPRKVLFVQPKTKLFRTLVFTSTTKSPLRVTLQKPTGTITGRIVTGDKQVPRPGLKVTAVLTRKFELFGGELPFDLTISRDAWNQVLKSEATTDAKGRFRLEGLIPGLKYWIYWENRGVLYGGDFDAVAVDSKKTIDLGDLSTTQVAPKKGEQ